MRFFILLFCWVAFFGWDFASNEGRVTIVLGTRFFHLIHLSGLI